MRGPRIVTQRCIDRRTFLRGAGVALALPFLDSMTPAFAQARKPSSPLAPGATPRRMLGICNNLGLLADQFFPVGGGRDYVPSPYLKLLQEHRNDFSVFTGVSHPNVDGGHPADVCFHRGAPSRRRFVPQHDFARSTHRRTDRYTHTLSLSDSRGQHAYTQPFLDRHGRCHPAGRQSGIRIQRDVPAGKPRADRCADPQTRHRTEHPRRHRWSGRRSQASVGARDRERLDQYFTSVRDLEHRLQASKGWERKPKPVVKEPAPMDPTNPALYMDKVKVMYDLARLALETDSTRSITLMLEGVSAPVLEIPDVTLTDSYHNLSHHGKSESKRAQLKIIDEWHMKLLAGLIASLKSVREGEDTLLDRTIILYGSNFGDANAHVCTNMPIILAGGGFRHGQNLAFDIRNNYPLPNLYVSMLQRMGIESDRFASSTGTMRGLEFA